MRPAPQTGRLPARHGTPFHPRTAALCRSQSWRNWSGYSVATSYDLTHEPEYFAIRTAAALIDVSPLFKYEISGPEAEALINRVVTRDVARLVVGQMLYTPWCDEAGKVIDDGTVARLAPDRYRLTSAHPSLRWLTENAVDLEVEIEDVSDRLAALALQGPNARAILQRVAGGEAGSLRYYRLTGVLLDGRPISVSRTGYTGDLGYELWIPAEEAVAVWDVLMDAGGPYRLAPAGLLALDMARIEAGLLLIDVDYISAHRAMIETQKSSPFELGLGWTVRLEKAYFVGREALQAETRRGIRFGQVGLEVHWEAIEGLYAEVGLPPQLPTVPWRSGVPVYAGRRQVGKATSGCWSPLLKKYIALANLEAGHARPGTPVEMEITVEYVRRRAPARVVAPPFFNPPRKRA